MENNPSNSYVRWAATRSFWRGLGGGGLVVFGVATVSEGDVGTGLCLGLGTSLHSQTAASPRTPSL